MDESHLSGKEIVPPGGVALVSTNRCEKEREEGVNRREVREKVR